MNDDLKYAQTKQMHMYIHFANKIIIIFRNGHIYIYIKRN